MPSILGYRPKKCLCLCRTGQSVCDSAFRGFFSVCCVCLLYSVYISSIYISWTIILEGLTASTTTVLNIANKLCQASKSFVKKFDKTLWMLDSLPRMKTDSGNLLSPFPLAESSLLDMSTHPWNVLFPVCGFCTFVFSSLCSCIMSEPFSCAPGLDVLFNKSSLRCDRESISKQAKMSTFHSFYARVRYYLHSLLTWFSRISFRRTKFTTTALLLF